MPKYILHLIGMYTDGMWSHWFYFGQKAGHGTRYIY